MATLQDQMMALVRAFGLQGAEWTPCGQPMSVSAAYALTELAGDGSLSQTELAGRLRLEKSTVSRLVDHLEDRGWLRREPDSADGRAVRLGLTEAGRRAFERLSAARAERFARLAARIPAAEQASVRRALEVLVRAMDESREENSPCRT